MNIFSSGSFNFNKKIVGNLATRDSTITRTQSQTNFKNNSKQQVDNKISPPLPQCLFHPSNTLSNFCASPQCLLPMCATCIQIHNDDHTENNTHGRYLSLLDVREDIKIFYGGSLKFFQSISKEYTQDYKDKLNIKNVFQTKYKQFKDKTFRELDRLLAQLQNSLLTNVEKFIENSLEQYSNIEQKVQQQYQNIKRKLQTINNEKGIKNIINYYKSQKKQFEGFKENVRKEAQQLRKQGLIIVIPEGIDLRISNIVDGIKVKSSKINNFGESQIQWIRVPINSNFKDQ